MPITKPCKHCSKDTRIENLTCADSSKRVPDCMLHYAGAESVPGCDEVYCEVCWERDPTSPDKYLPKEL